MLISIAFPFLFNDCTILTKEMAVFVFIKLRYNDAQNQFERRDFFVLFCLKVVSNLKFTQIFTKSSQSNADLGII